MQVEPQGVFFCLILAFDRGWDGTKLLHHTHTIHLAPMLYQLSIRNTDNVDHAKGYALAGGWDAQKLALLGAIPGHAEYHLVVFGEDVINCGFEIWEGAAQHGGQHVEILGLRPRPQGYRDGHLFAVSHHRHLDRLPDFRLEHQVRIEVGEIAHLPLPVEVMM
jgi:hypothetical protein